MLRLPNILLPIIKLATQFFDNLLNFQGDDFPNSFISAKVLSFSISFLMSHLSNSGKT